MMQQVFTSLIPDDNFMVMILKFLIAFVINELL